MHEQLKQATNAAQTYGITKPAPTLFGKVEQASKWCVNPHYYDNGLGEQASRLVIEEGRKLAIKHKDPVIRDDFMQTSYECEVLVNRLVKLQHQLQEQLKISAQQPIQIDNDNIKNISLNSIGLGKQLQEKLNTLGQKITKDLIQQVADDFIDINYPIRKLADLVMSPPGKIFLFCFSLNFKRRFFA